MNVSFNIGQTGLTNVHRINQSIAAQNSNNGSIASSKPERSDSITISPQGKKNSLLDNLMKQKTNITEQKNSLISSTLEKGGTLDTIKSQLENYDEQMKSVDKQIAEIMAKEMEKQAEELKKQENSKPKTKDEIQNDRLASLTNLSVDLQQVKTISSVQANIEGDARVLKSEIKLDKMYAGSSPGSQGMIAKKEVVLASMEQKSLDLTSKIAEELSDVVEKANDINKPQEVDSTDKPSVAKHGSLAESSKEKAVSE